MIVSGRRGADCTLAPVEAISTELRTGKAARARRAAVV
jgi:hypothetical protein